MNTTPPDRLSSLRGERGLSQSDLGDAAGVSKATVSMIESGKRAGRLATWTALADALDTTEAWLLYGVS